MSNPDKNLSINQNIEVVISEGPYQGSYNSKVSDLLEEKIKVMAIYKREELIPLRKGVEVQLLYEGDSAFYSLTTEILGREKYPIPTLILKRTNEVNRIQRRRYFRLQVNKKIKYKSLKDIEDEKKEAEFKKTTAVDLSGGGLLMVLRDDLNLKEKLVLNLNIENLDKLVKGRIVRIKHNQDGYSKTAGIEFIEMERKDRDKIISFLFNYQRKLRRRGMI
ncbi:MAG TPA: PilZ domain-containing protein [Halanaerobiales bacterium]|nr:PilZ domain-containing protein [Halanaerobiales bacterium]